MKVGIVTFHAARNYGAVLQCRCLKEVLSSLGHEVHVVDYRPRYLTEPYRILKPYYLKRPSILFRLPVRYWGARRRDCSFSRFQQDLSPVPAGTSFDAVFFGSDQIWNPKICKGLDPFFFAADPSFANTRNIAYAASDGSAPLDDSQSALYRRYMQHFHRIGVREASLQERLSSWGIPSSVTLDPVLLAGREVVARLASGIKVSRQAYVLTYEAVDHPRVKELAAGMGQRVISIAREPYSAGRNCYGPQEFVALFRDAARVVTTSFHGVALSVLFHKDFLYVETGTRADDRIRNLLTAIGLENRMVAPGKDPINGQPGYSEADVALEGLRNSSLDFIKEALL
ncbi:MAG: polysaccharide pyruvyl transferase family protein [Bacteroidales bacterium]|nr:polysaccharide pyruvyl transferase family protein [Bacteroidales bacterium]